MARKRRRRKSRSIGLPIIILLFLSLVAMVVVIAYWYINGNKLRLPGEWYREIDITESVKSTISDYLEEAMMGNEIDVDSYVSSIKIRSNLVIDKEGNVSEHIDSNSYTEAAKAAQSALENAVSDLIVKRLDNNFIETDMTPSQLVDETFGMELSEYLKQYGPKLIVEYGIMDSEYGMDATYSASREEMIISKYDGDINCEYAVASRMLVINYVNETIVYHHNGLIEEKVGVEIEEQAGGEKEEKAGAENEE